MKKIILIITLLFSSFILFANKSIHAISNHSTILSITNDSYNESDWYRDGDYMYYSPIENDSQSFWDNGFNANGHHSFVIYGKYKDITILEIDLDGYGFKEIPLNLENKNVKRDYLSIYMDNLDKETYERSGWVNATTSYVGTTLTDYISPHKSIMVIPPKEHLTNFEAPRIRFFLPEQWEEIPSNPDITDINNLPGTKSNKIGTVNFKVEGFNLTVQINYEAKVYYLLYKYSSEQDMELFDTIESYYMNINNKPQIIISHGDQKYLHDILTAKENEKPAFVPHSVWDLKTNDIQTKDRYATNVYIKQNKKGVVVSYVYIDEFIIDKMISATVRWTSRQKNSFPASIFMGKYTEYETHEQTLVNDRYLEYRDLTSNWQTYIPIWNVIRGVYQIAKTYEMQEIQSVNLNNIQKDFNVTKNEIESYFRSANKDFTELNKNPRYQVWALALQSGVNYLDLKTEMFPQNDNPNDERNFKIINIDYITNGKLYVADGNDMDLFISIAPGLTNQNPVQTGRTIIDTIIFIGAVLLVVSILVKSKAFTSLRKFLTTSVIILIVGAGLYILWTLFDAGTIFSLILRL